jgi:hypothetical protein
MPGAYVRPEEADRIPGAPRTSRFIRESASVGGRSSRPMTIIRRCRADEALIAMPRSRRSRYSAIVRQPQSKPGGSSFQPASWTRSASSVSSFTGA